MSKASQKSGKSQTSGAEDTVRTSLMAPVKTICLFVKLFNIDIFFLIKIKLVKNVYPLLLSYKKKNIIF